MGYAVIAAAVMSPVHALFGVQIVRRGLIFIDLAVAQVAALGMSIAIANGHEAHSNQAYLYSVVSALIGALLISLTRHRLGRVPHEAIIGTVYVLSTAASIVVLEFAPSGHGMEELKAMLAGNIIFVEPGQVQTTAITYAIVLGITLLIWRHITAITLDKSNDAGSTRTIFFDFAFYALLGFVVASSVKIAGVLVVFSWLVMPAIVAFFAVENMKKAAFIAIPIGVIGSIIGLLISYYAPALPFDHSHDEPNAIEAAGQGGWPTGPSIVLALAAVVTVSYLIHAIRNPKAAPPSEA